MMHRRLVLSNSLKSGTDTLKTKRLMGKPLSCEKFTYGHRLYPIILYNYYQLPASGKAHLKQMIKAATYMLESRKNFGRILTVGDQ